MHSYLERDRTARIKRRPLSACLLASVLPVVVASLLMLAGPIAWRSMQGIDVAHPVLADCAAIAGNADRLACYDSFQKDATRQPAKGANALFASH